MPLPDLSIGLVIRYEYLWHRRAARIPLRWAMTSASKFPVKIHLGLDDDRSWVIVSECNIDSWPTPDLRQIPQQPGEFAYGHIPPRLFKNIRDAFVNEYRARRVRQVTRGKEQAGVALATYAVLFPISAA